MAWGCGNASLCIVNSRIEEGSCCQHFAAFVVGRQVTVSKTPLKFFNDVATYSFLLQKRADRMHLFLTGGAEEGHAIKC